ncbi:MAG: hypothetical protein JKX94_03775, partial [Sneathiella sp.]|nr:hypothetical protein [Sneathiella sp.]
MAEKRNSIDQASRERGSSKPAVSNLWELQRFVSPYKWQFSGAMVALVFASASVLLIGQAIRLLLDNGFSAGSENLDQYFIGLMGVVGALAFASFARYYLV